MARFSNSHYRLVSPPSDTPEDVRQRLLRRQAVECAIADRETRFPELTATNAADAIRFQEERTKYHEMRLGVK